MSMNPMTADEALTLHRLDRIRIRQPHGSRSRMAMVMDEPSREGQWVVFGYSFLVDPTPGDEVISGQRHVAVLGGIAPHQVEKE